MKINGEVEHIIFQNNDNGFVVARLKTDEDNLIITGIIPFLENGDYLSCKGEYTQNRKYGFQFNVQSATLKYPQTLVALTKYLTKGKIKGIGPVNAQRVVDEFGMDSIDVIKNEPEKLTKIKGITLKKANQISEDFKKNEEVWRVSEFLDKFNLGIEYSKKVIDNLGENAITKIENNPYILVDISKRVSFPQIDNIAQRLGISQYDNLRVTSAIKYIMAKYMANGHCYIVQSDLFIQLQDLLKVDKKYLENGLIELSVEGEITRTKVTLDGKCVDVVYLTPYYEAEKRVAQKLIKLKKSNLQEQIEDIDEKIEKVEEETNIVLSNKQKEALKLVNDNNICVITGGPGTGKTTIINTIIKLYKQKNKKVVLTAPTGRAAKRMTEATGEKASTLHRLLEIGKLDDELNEVDYEPEPIEADIVIVDEMSMVDIFLMNMLMRSLPLDTKLVLVGDSNQLSSVGPGNVLKDIIESDKIESIKLDKIFRQAAKSKIIQNAHRVNNGQMILKNKENSNEQDALNQDFFYIELTNPDKIEKEILTLAKERLQKFGDYDFMNNIQVLTPTRKGRFGVSQLNKLLQENLNTKHIKDSKGSKELSDFRIDDRVMQVKNNYNISWQSIEEVEKGKTKTGIFNGEMGRITDIDTFYGEIEVLYDDNKVALYKEEEIEQLELAYATTIHKAQGSEYDVVILVISQASKFLLTRNLLYTAITRAKQMLILISDDETIKYMVSNVDSRKRNTALKEQLQKTDDFNEEKHFLKSFNLIKEKLKKKKEE